MVRLCAPVLREYVALRIIGTGLIAWVAAVLKLRVPGGNLIQIMFQDGVGMLGAIRLRVFATGAALANKNSAPKRRKPEKNQHMGGK